MFLRLFGPVYPLIVILTQHLAALKFSADRENIPFAHKKVLNQIREGKLQNVKRNVLLIRNAKKQKFKIRYMYFYFRLQDF